MVVKLSAYGLVGGRKPSRNDLAHCVKGDLGLRQLSSERLDHTWRWGTARGSTGANDGSFICLRWSVSLNPQIMAQDDHCSGEGFSLGLIYVGMSVCIQLFFFLFI